MTTQTRQAIPQVELALITGSANWGLRFPEDIGVEGVSVIARDVAFETSHGVSENWKILEFDGRMTPDGKLRRALCMYSHGNPRGHIDHSCHRRAYAVLQEAGVKRIIASSTIGALNRAIQVGDFVINADIIELTQTPFSLLPGRQRFDASGKQIVCPACAGILADVARQHWPASGRVYGIEVGLVAAHAYGPRLTTPAEVIAYRTLGADIINHSIAPEATLAREIGACFVPCAFVTAGFNDYFRNPAENVLREGVLDGLSPLASRIALLAAARLPRAAECQCQGLKSPQPDERHLSW
ncbi:5'-methylthioadenosine phosphorylase [Aestuariivirga sp.]|uniref:phosphorylase family protein n=1 Tax=Aestuariivirga sp. TaxID=2650926 RepID=UPI0035933D36